MLEEHNIYFSDAFILLKWYKILNILNLLDRNSLEVVHNSWILAI